MSAILWATAWNLPIGLAELRARARVGDRGLQQALDGADVRRERGRMRSQSMAVREHAGAAADRRRAPRRRPTQASSNTSSPIGEVRSPIFSNFWPGAKSGRAALDQKRRDAAVKPLLGVGDGEHDHDVGDRAIGDERLRAVDAPAAAVALGAQCAARTRRSPSRARSSRARRSACRRTVPAGSAASAPRCRASRAAPRRRADARRARTPVRRRGSRSPAPRAPMAQVSGSAPLPPYSSGTGRPWMPISAHLRQSSREKALLAVALDARRGSARRART